MTLRAKLLALFFSLGVVPLLALGLLSYVRSTRALEGLLETRTQAIASRAAEVLSHRYVLSISDLQYLADNAESQRLMRMGADFEGAEPGPARAEAISFLDAAWQTVGSSWRWAELRTSTAAIPANMGGRHNSKEAGMAPGRSPLQH
jgi:hypothetical protein